MTAPGPAAAAPHRRDWRTDDGLTLVADVFGAPVRGSALLLHGGGQTRHAWGGTGAALAAAGWQAVALDLRGHGDSAWSPQGAYALSRLARDAVTIAECLSPPRVLIGASLGGMSLLHAAGRSAPQLADGLVLVDVVPRMEGGGVRRIVRFMQAHQDGFADLDAAAEAVAAYRRAQGSAARAPDLQGLRKNLRRRDDGRWYWHWDPQLLTPREPTAMADYLGLFQAAEALRCPTLLVRGKRSDVVSERGVADFRARVPHAEFVDVAGAGHMVAGDDNTAFSAAILEFLQRRLPA
ncbi:MAG TPA: alpha/beta hydrolase [Gammaproteobacteria bacterium]|nr:alpha/beta hydrolase [Gammaproteobacteria bacterium]